MFKSNSSQRRALRAWAFASLVVLAIVAVAWPEAAGASAQSGRRKAAPVSPVPTPTPAPEASQGESESVPRGSEKKPGVIVSLVVMENEDLVTSIDHFTRREVIDEFVHRLGQSSAVTVTPAGRGSRKKARDRAKFEREAYVVLFHLEEEDEYRGRRSTDPSDARKLVIRLYVFEPVTANLKFSDVVYQRPLRETVTVGGVPLPVPRRRIGRYPSEHELKQAARDAADRLMARFHVILPPER